VQLIRQTPPYVRPLLRPCRQSAGDSLRGRLCAGLQCHAVRCFCRGAAAVAAAQRLLFCRLSCRWRPDDRAHAGPEKRSGVVLHAAHHAVRHPASAAGRGRGNPVLRVVMLSEILRSVRMLPVQRTREPADATARRCGRTETTVRNGHLQEGARCKEGAVLVFWPRPRRTFLPADAVPQRPDGANEPREGGDEEGEEDEELGGVEGSRRALFGD